MLDTNVVSELRKGTRCNPSLAAWMARHRAESFYLSVLTLGELRKGIEGARRRDKLAARALEVWFSDLINVYADRLLGVDQAIAEQWGQLNVPDPLPVIDGLLAATATVHGLTLVSRNLKDVKRTGVPCVDPFATAPPPPNRGGSGSE